MKIKEFDLSDELVSKGVEFFQREKMLGSIRLRAEHTIQIADIRYFEITPGNHHSNILNWMYKYTTNFRFT